MGFAVPLTDRSNQLVPRALTKKRLWLGKCLINFSHNPVREDLCGGSGFCYGSRSTGVVTDARIRVMRSEWTQPKTVFAAALPATCPPLLTVRYPFRRRVLPTGSVCCGRSANAIHLERTIWGMKLARNATLRFTRATLRRPWRKPAALPCKVCSRKISCTRPLAGITAFTPKTARHG
jgi:hypothetical protein